MFDRLKKIMEEAAEEGEKLFSRVKDKGLFRRVVSASFLIARADGDFDHDERKALGKVIAKELPQFKMGDILKILSECQSKVEFDETMGIREIMQDISEASGADAELIMRISCFIGAADGDFDADEKQVAKTLATSMGINPARYGL